MFTANRCSRINRWIRDLRYLSIRNRCKVKSAISLLSSHLSIRSQLLSKSKAFFPSSGETAVHEMQLAEDLICVAVHAPDDHKHSTIPSPLILFFALAYHFQPVLIDSPSECAVGRRPRRFCWHIEAHCHGYLEIWQWAIGLI